MTITACPMCHGVVTTGHGFCSVTCRRSAHLSYDATNSEAVNGRDSTRPLTAAEATAVTAMRDAMAASLAAVTDPGDGTEGY